GVWDVRCVPAMSFSGGNALVRGHVGTVAMRAAPDELNDAAEALRGSSRLEEALALALRAVALAPFDSAGLDTSSGSSDARKHSDCGMTQLPGAPADWAGPLL